MNKLEKELINNIADAAHDANDKEIARRKADAARDAMKAAYGAREAAYGAWEAAYGAWDAARDAYYAAYADLGAYSEFMEVKK